MIERWANPGNPGLDELERVQRSLTVNLIMAPRKDLKTCRCDETASAVMAGNKQRFSFLPVVDADSIHILGLYDAKRWFDGNAPNEQIGDDFEKFSEEIVIGADASIVDFVKVADKRPTRLVVSGNCVAGLVSLSDLQLLPVRAALFTLLTRLELTMSERIESHFKDSEAWLSLLSPGRRSLIEEKICKAKESDGFVTEIALSQLEDKVDIIVKEQLIQGSKTKLRNDFKLITKLRNSIAHANHYAESLEEAYRVCITVRSILRFMEELSDQ